MSDLLLIRGVRERDIDLLLVEEFFVSPNFRSWFARQILNDARSFTKLVRITNSAADTTGETDIDLQLEDEYGTQLTLLIENKINAGLQPNQARRYQTRGKNNISPGGELFQTVLIAPESYFGRERQHKGFHARVTYEVILDWFSHHSPSCERNDYKQQLLTTAITKGRLGYNPSEDAMVTAFWRKYWEMAIQCAPELQMAEPGGKPAGSSFVTFPKPLKGEKEIWHKMSHGNVDLQFKGKGQHLEELKDRYAAWLDHDMTLVKAEQSASIRLKVPVLNPNSDFDSQAGQVLVGISAAKRLFAWYMSCSMEDK